MINLCVTTFNRQDLLGRMLVSAFAGTTKPDAVFLVDQAQNPWMLASAFSVVPPGVPVRCIDLGPKRGCEASAINWFLQHVDEERIIVHDDVEFGPESIARFVEVPGAFLIDDSQGVITYRKECVDKVGLYDITISPNYFRYVDCDYEERLAEVGIEPTVVGCGIRHERNGTMRAMNSTELDNYYRRCGIADANYQKKWGRPLTPGGSTIDRSMWRILQRKAS